jgi:hypothetical protein
MINVSLLPGEAVVPASMLPDALSATPVADMATAMGKLPAPSDIAGLVRRADGRTWLLAHHEPLVSRDELGANVDRPWVHPIGLRFKTLYGPIADVAAILNDPNSEHAEVKRRQALHEEMEREAHERRERNLAEQRAAGAAQTEERHRQERARREFRWDAWGPLPVGAKICYAAALAVADGEDLATTLRRLGGELASTDTVPFPERRWW